MDRNCENIDTNNLEMESPAKKKRRTSSRHAKPILQMQKYSDKVAITNGNKRNRDETLPKPPTVTKHLKISNTSHDKNSKIDTLAMRLKANVTTNDSITKNERISNVSQVNSSNKSQNFITTLRKVSTQKYSNIRDRLKIQILPECCYNKYRCEKIHKNSEVHMISSYEKEAFKINFKSGLWDEALIVCQQTLNKKHYLSAGILQNIIEILMNVHHDGHKDYSSQFIIQGFERIMKKMFTIHLPCSQKIIENYRNFLTEPLMFESPESEEESDKPQIGLFKFILKRLEFELNRSSPDGPIINTDIEKFDDNLNDMYLRKRKYEIYETHDRKERISRLFIILDIIVDLLEKDLAIWIAKYIENPSRYISGKKKTLTASLLWQDNPILIGVVTDNCRQIFRIYSHLVKLHFPLRNIETFTKLVDVCCNTFYVCEKNCNIEYPHIGNCCITLANEFYKIIEDEEVSTIISIIAKMKTTYIQFLLTKTFITLATKSEHEDFILSVDDIFKREIWNTFPEIYINGMDTQSIFGKSELKNNKVKLDTSHEKTYLKALEQHATKQSSALSELKKSLKKHDTDFFYSNIFANLWTKDKLIRALPLNFARLKEYNERSSQTNVNDLNKSDFIIIFYLSFKYFLELYNISDIKKYYKGNFETLPKIVKNKTSQTSDCFNDINHNTARGNDTSKSTLELKLSVKCIKEYVLMFKTMKQIGITYEELQKKNLLPTNIFENLNFFIRK